jgi:Protein of unknown function (DUF2490)
MIQRNPNIGFLRRSNLTLQAYSANYRECRALVKLFWSLAVVFFYSSPELGFGQSTPPLRGAEKSSWYMYFGDHPFTKNCGVHLETQYRAQGVGQDPTQLLVRPGIVRFLPKNIVVSLLYANVRDYPFQGGPLADLRRTGPQQEHRLAEEFRWTHTLANYSGKRATAQHRFRLEQRWFGQSSEGQGVYDWHFAERVRYRIYTPFPLPFNTKNAWPDYVAAYNEILVRFGPHGGTSAIDQNRTYGAIGWNLSSEFNLEVGYLHQYLPRSNGFVGEHNNAFQFSISSTAPLKKLFGR